MKTSSILFGAVGICFLTSATLASNVADTDIVTFTANSTAKAAEVNQNFTAVKNAVNTKQNAVSETCAAGSAISAINSDGTVECEADDNSGGTITAVNAGAGLSGGGSSGSVNLSIPTGGITPNLIAADAVNSAKITDEPGVAALVNSAAIIISPTSPGTVLLSKTISAPAAGYVIATFSGSIYMGGLPAASNYMIRLKLNSGTSANVTEDGYVIFIRDTNSNSGTRMLPVASTRAFPVPQAQLFTVGLTGWLQIDPAATGGIFLDDSTLTLLYVPTDYASP